MSARLKAMGSAKYQADGDPRTSGPGFGVAAHPDALDIPRRWHTPRHVFVDSMSDLFHAGVPDEFIARVFAVMAATPQHTYQLLTKRHGRMRSLIGDAFSGGTALISAAENAGDTDSARALYEADGWPLPNVWLGVSAEDQRWADVRVPALLDTAAAIRFVSCEPLLGPVDLTRLATRGGAHLDALAGEGALGWVIVGGESGRGARPFDVEWVRDLIVRCEAAGVPVFVKQLGSMWAQGHEQRGKGGDPAAWPEDLRVRQMPGPHARTPGVVIPTSSQPTAETEGAG